jgi:radical SAM protein with 4Fe4S-binding SPASM domain
LINYLSKSYNLALAGSSYLGSLLSPELTLVRGMPVSISAELTNNCNLKCPECSAGSGQMARNRGFMDIGLFKKAIEELKPYLYNINLYFQGEPMLHPLFFSFIENCRGIYSTVSTNGHFLSPDNSEKIVKSGLGKLIISLDGTDQDSYSAYRINGDLESVTTGISLVSEAKFRNRSPIKLEIQLLVNRFNEHQVPKARALAKKLRASLSLKSMQIINKENTGLWLPVNRKYRRYEMVDGKYVNKNSLPNRCARLWFNPVITWDGKVISCCFDKDAEHIMGDLSQESFREIWNGPRYRVFRRAILKDRSMTEICRNCTSGLTGVKY